MGGDQVGSQPGVVSVWVGDFPSVAAAEAYFGIPDEVGVYQPPDGFLADLGVADLPPECLEANFERLAPRPLADLLADATFAPSFLGPAVEAAALRGIRAAQGVALVYDFDYTAVPGWRPAAGPVRFVGAFPFARPAGAREAGPRPDPRIEVRDVADDVW